MAKTRNAKKAQRASLKKRVFNARRKKALHDMTKIAQRAVGAGTAATTAALPAFQQAIDKAAKHGTIKKNTAARMKSRMAKRIAALGKK